MLETLQRNTYITWILALGLFLALWLPEWTASTDFWIAGGACLLSAVLLFVVNRRHLFCGNNEHLFLLFYILLGSALPDTLRDTGSHIASICLIISLHYLFKTYQLKNALAPIFISVLFAGIASMFYFTAIAAVLAISISILTSRTFYWRDGVALLGGLACPYFYLGLYYFMNGGNLYPLWDGLSVHFTQACFPSIANKLFDYIFVALLSLLLLWSLFAGNPAGALNKIKVSYMRQAIITLLICLLTASVFLHPPYGSIMSLLAIPMAIIFANNYEQIRQKKIYWFLLLILCTAIIGSRLS